MADNIPSHYGSEKQKGMTVIAVGVFSSLFLLIHLVQSAPIISYAIGGEFTKETWNVVSSALSHFYSMQVFMAGAKASYSQNGLVTIICFLITIIFSILPAVLAIAFNPYRTFDLHQGDAKFGTMTDIKMMEQRKQVGIRGGKYLHLGIWPKTGEAMRLIETLSALVLAPPGTGKSLAPHEPVLFYDGKIGRTDSVKVGDQLMGPDGTPRNVSNTNLGKGPMFKVIPEKGKPFECNADHILSLRSDNILSRWSLNPFNRLCYVTVEQWLKWPEKKKSKWKMWRTGVDFPKRENPLLEPYFMGLMLSRKNLIEESNLQAQDPEIIKAIRSQLQTIEWVNTHALASNGSTYSVSPTKNHTLNNILNKYNMSKDHDDASIHYDYRQGSRKTRLELLAGYIDADGEYDEKENTFKINGKNRRVIEDIAFVARSLGLAAYISPNEENFLKDNVSGIASEVSINGNLSVLPIRVKAKKPKKSFLRKNVNSLGFDIKQIEDGLYYGIIVDGDHQYLLADFTVTHNTASFVVPSIIDTPESSFIVNDPKPELFDLTSGYRAQIGNVYMINWSATDKVDPSNLNDPKKTIFYPRFNVLSPKLLPPAGTAERDTYLDAIANVMSPSSGKGGGNSDYFEQKGRAALVGFLHYICSKVADRSSETRDLANIPSQYHGENMEPSIPMLIDMVNEGLRLASDKNDADKKEAAENQQMHQGDAMSDWLKGIISECVANDYNPRAITEITPLVSMAPNERSGILGTMDKAFLPFKNAAVRERTQSCDFLPADLRGQEDENGIMRPVTLYVCVNQAEAAAFATITSLLYEVLSREYLAYGPGEVNRNGTKLGPYPVCFMLDEFAKLPRIEAVMTGPDLGRSKKTMYCLVAQSDAQIGKLYSKEDQQIIYATTAIKYILPQNDDPTVKVIQAMVGPTTIKRKSNSKTRGGDIKEWGKSNESTSLEKVDFLRAGDITAMKPGTHIIIAQGFMNRPYMMKSVLFFEDPVMLSKVFNPRTNLGPPPAYPVPERVRLERIEEWRKKNTEEARKGDAQSIAVDLSKYESVPEPMAT